MCTISQALGNVSWQRQQLERKDTNKISSWNIICENWGVASCENTSKNDEIIKVRILFLISLLTRHSMQAADHLLLNWDSNWILSAVPSSKLWSIALARTSWTWTTSTPGSCVCNRPCHHDTHHRTRATLREKINVIHHLFTLWLQ